MSLYGNEKAFKSFEELFLGRKPWKRNCFYLFLAQ